jgi:transposase
MNIMIPKKIPKDIELKESIEEAFLKDDFKVSDQVPALYEKMMTERGGGRSSYRGKMTPARYEAIIKYIRNGAHLSHAANAVGIDDTTIYRWVKWGIEDPESLYGLFVEDLQRAKGLAILRNVTIVQRAAEDDWNAAKWLLSVLDPQVFGNKSTVKTELSTIDGGTIESGFFISDEELKKLTKIQDSIEEENKVVDVKFETLPDEDSSSSTNG